MRRTILFLLFGICVLTTIPATSQNVYGVVSEGTLEDVMNLMDYDIDLNYSDGNGTSVFMVAAANNPDVRVLQFLSEHGANMHALDRTGKSALFMHANTIRIQRW